MIALNNRCAFGARAAIISLFVAAPAFSLFGQTPKPGSTGEPQPKQGVVRAKDATAQNDGGSSATAQPVETGANHSAKEEERPPALGGYCPASYLLEGKAVKGNPALAVPYAGEVFYLANAEAKEKFIVHPDRFSPQFSGLCTTALGGSYGNRIPGDPEVFDIRDGKVYLFSSERAKRAYETRPEWFISRAEELFFKPALDGYGPVTLLQRGKALRGGGSVRCLYRGRYYDFLNMHLRAVFLRDPQKYLPQYGGYCTEGMSRGKRFVASPDQFVVRDGKVFLFFDNEARMEFLSGPEKMIKKADFFWSHLEH